MAFLDAQSRTVLFDPPDVYEEALARDALSAEDIAFAEDIEGVTTRKCWICPTFENVW